MLKDENALLESRIYKKKLCERTKMPQNACFIFSLFLREKISFYYMLKNKMTKKTLVNSSIFFFYFGGKYVNVFLKTHIPSNNFLITDELLKKIKLLLAHRLLFYFIFALNDKIIISLQQLTIQCYSKKPTLYI